MKMNDEEREKERIRKIHEERRLRRIEAWPEDLERIIQVYPELIQDDLRMLKEDEVLKKHTLTETKGVYVWGPVGSGKTIFVIFLLIKYIREQWLEHRLSHTFLFTSTNDLLYLLRRSQIEKTEISEFDILDKYCNIDILVLDDIGIEKTSDWVFQMLFQLINYRHLHKKKTLITSNFSLNQLVDKLGDDRISSRLQQSCIIIEKSGIDYRSLE
jgi:DNA replication protein DnaC